MTSQPTQPAASGATTTRGNPWHHTQRMNIHLLWAVHHAHQQYPDPQEAAKAVRRSLNEYLRRWEA